jgi:hypothetical protein
VFAVFVVGDDDATITTHEALADHASSQRFRLRAVVVFDE